MSDATNGHQSTSAVATANETKSQRWSPMTSLLSDMQRDFDRVFGPGFSSLLPFRRMGSSGSGWMPQVDIFEKSGNLVVKAELPGVNKADIDVSIDDTNLIIRGERRAENEVQEDQYYRMERSYGSFYRSIPLPKGVRSEDVAAKFEDGILTVTVAKAHAEERATTRVNVE
jgi:HSP20 family protein